MTKTEQKNSAVRSMAWKLCLGGWRDDPSKMRLLPYAAMFYSGIKTEQWLRQELPAQADQILAWRPDFVSQDCLLMAVAFMNGS